MADGVKVVGAPEAPSRGARRPEARRSPERYRTGRADDSGAVAVSERVESVPAVDAPVEEVIDTPIVAVAADGLAADVVTADAAEVHPAPAPLLPAPSTARRRLARRRRIGVVALAVVALAGIAGTLAFGFAWAGLHSQSSGEAQAEQAARGFVVDLTNFNAKTVDADFAAVTAMATGKFATQAAGFFNSTIRQALQQALASSRGQIRSLYVQSYGGGQASVYAVVDQLYVNNKVPSPQTDVLRMVVDLVQKTGSWKVGDLTVLQGPTAAGSTAASANPAVTAGGAGRTTATTAPAAG